VRTPRRAKTTPHLYQLELFFRAIREALYLDHRDDPSAPSALGASGPAAHGEPPMTHATQEDYAADLVGPEPETCADFVFTVNGDAVIVDAHSDAAIDHAWENFQVERWQGSPDHFVTDWRTAAELCSQLASAGWRTVEC